MHHSYDECPRCKQPKRKIAKLCRECCYKTGDRRQCTTCERSLEVSMFRLRTRRNPKPRSTCKQCESIAEKRRYFAKPIPLRKASTRRWEKENPEKHRASVLRRRIRMLGLGDILNTIVKLVGEYRCCPLCKRKPEQSRMHIDHDHRTGKFRGLICQSCNIGLGHFNDDPSVLVLAVRYLNRFKKEQSCLPITENTT